MSDVVIMKIEITSIDTSLDTEMTEKAGLEMTGQVDPRKIEKVGPETIE